MFLNWYFMSYEVFQCPLTRSLRTQLCITNFGASNSKGGRPWKKSNTSLAKGPFMWRRMEFCDYDFYLLMMGIAHYFYLENEWTAREVLCKDRLSLSPYLGQEPHVRSQAPGAGHGLCFTASPAPPPAQSTQTITRQYFLNQPILPTLAYTSQNRQFFPK